MTALVWDATGEKVYEDGLDRGVLYVQNKGVVWNGLVSVDDAGVDSVAPVYIDGIKIRNVVAFGDFEATLTAYTYPDEFMLCDGFELHERMYIDTQNRQEFGLTYRTGVGNDIAGQGHAYKLHLVYNLTAMPDTKTYKTMSLSPEPVEFSWILHSRPVEMEGYRPTAHFIIDSRLWDPEMLAAFEELLYGTATSPPTLPPFETLIELVNPLTELLIVDEGSGEWSGIDLNANNLSFPQTEVFEIDAPTVVMIDADTFEVSTYVIGASVTKEV